MEYAKQISEIRSRIQTLDASLDNQRTPYLKSQLRHAGHNLDDAESMLRQAAKATSHDATMWHELAEWNIQFATQIWDKVHDLVERYGGPSNVQEVG